MLKSSNYFNRDLTESVYIAKKNSNERPVPNSCMFNEEEYWKYGYRFKNKLVRILKESYVVIRHSHKDIYVHETKPNLVDKILDDGYLISSDDCDNAIGKGVYTFPLYSGRFSVLSHDSKYIVFTSKEEHCHIVATDDGNHELGEADFLTDRLEIINPHVYSLGEIQKLSEECFNSRFVLKDYYGIDYNGEVTYDSLCDIVTSFNY